MRSAVVRGAPSTGGPDVLIVQRYIPRYRAPFFQVLREHSEMHHIRIQVVFGSPSEVELSRRDDEGAEGIRVVTRYFGRCSWLAIPWRQALSASIAVLPHEVAQLHVWVILLLRSILNRPVALWGHGRNFQRKSMVADRLRRFMIKCVPLYLAYTSVSRDELTAAGYPEDRIVVLNNTVDTKALTREFDQLTDDDANAYKMSLGLGAGPVVCYVGAWTSAKRLFWIVDAAERLRSVFPISVIIAGAGPDATVLRKLSDGKPWIKLLGVVGPKDKALIFRVSQCFVNPGMVSLSIVDALACGLPVVATRVTTHSPEIAYLEHGVTGLLAGNTIDELTKSVATILESDQLRSELRHNARKLALELTLDNMASRFLSGIEQLRTFQGRY